MSRSIPNRIWMALKSALAERLTSWVTMASRLVTTRRPPLSVTTTSSLSALVSSVFIFLAPGGRPRGLPDWPLTKRVWRGGLPYPTSKSRSSSGGIGGLRLAHEVIKVASGSGMPGLVAGQSLPAANGGIDIAGIELQRAAAPARALRGNHRRAAAEKGVEHDLAARRAIEDRIGDHRHRFHGRVQRQEIALATAAGEGPRVTLDR